MKIISDRIAIGYHTRGSREPFIYARRDLTRDYFRGEAVARLKVRKQEICLPKDGELSIGSSPNKDDIYINDPAIGFGQIVIKGYERGLIISHYGRGKTTILAKSGQVIAELDEKSVDQEIQINCRINIRLDHYPQPLAIEVLIGKPRESLMPPTYLRPPIRQVEVEALIKQETSEPQGILLKDYSQAATAKEALEIYLKEVALVSGPIIKKENTVNQVGDQSILAGASFLTAAMVGSVYDSIMMQIVGRLWYGVGVVSSVMILGGMAIRAINHHFSQSYISSLRDALQDRFAERLRQCSSEEIADLIAQQDEPLRKELEKMVEIQIPTRSEGILLLAERQTLALPPKKD